MTDTDLAAEFWEIKEQLKELEARKEEIAAHFKRQTGDRVYGDYFVSVASITKQVLDTEQVKAILQDRTPYKPSVSVSLTVKRLSKVV